MFRTVGAFADRWLKIEDVADHTASMQPAEGRLFADPTVFFREPSPAT